MTEIKFEQYNFGTRTYGLIANQDFRLKITQRDLDSVDFRLWGTTKLSEFSKSQFEKFKNLNVKNFVSFAKKVINRFGTDGKILIQPATSSQDPVLGYQHLISARRLRNKQYLPFEKTVFEIDLSKPEEAQYILEHIAYLIGTLDTAFIFREWTDIDNDYNSIVDRKDKLIQYFNDHKNMICAVDFEGFLKIEDIYSGRYSMGAPRNEQIFINDYSTDSEGITFYNALNSFKSWAEIWIAKMSLGIQAPEAFMTYYWNYIKNGISESGDGRPETMRRILGLGIGGERS